MTCIYFWKGLLRMETPLNALPLKNWFGGHERPLGTVELPLESTLLTEMANFYLTTTLL